ncbi:MAG TPA: hypothetical protein VF796_22295 [Humisphaera sp.]
MRRGDETAVRVLADAAKRGLGDAAGLPEVPDEFRPAPPGEAPKLTPADARVAFDPYVPFLENRKWWKVGLDPTKTDKLPREVASVVTGCLAARAAGSPQGEKLLAMAKEAGGYLLWTQERGGRGVFPFPAYLGGGNRALDVGARFLRRAEQAGQLEKVVNNGWAVDDLGDGGLQFDNALCGVAILELHAATGDAKYLAAARSAADWAASRPPCPNWNYNSFGVYLLARAHQATGEAKYLDAAKRLARLGVYPGQLTDGPRAGRWADPHNARPAYHYIIIRGIAALRAALPAGDPDAKPATACLRLALAARNGDFAAKGVINADSAMEALLAVEALPPAARAELADTGIESALDVLERYAAAGYRQRRPAFAPGVWGQYLKHVSERPATRPAR